MLTTILPSLVFHPSLLVLTLGVDESLTESLDPARSMAPSLCPPRLVCMASLHILLILTMALFHHHLHHNHPRPLLFTHNSATMSHPPPLPCTYNTVTNSRPPLWHTAPQTLSYPLLPWPPIQTLAVAPQK